MNFSDTISPCPCHLWEKLRDTTYLVFFFIKKYYFWLWRWGRSGHQAYSNPSSPIPVILFQRSCRRQICPGWQRQTHPTYANEMKVCRRPFAKRQAEVCMSSMLLLSFTPPQAHSCQLAPLPWPKTTFIYISVKMEIPHTQKLQMKAHGNTAYKNLLLWRRQRSSIRVWLAP